MELKISEQIVLLKNAIESKNLQNFYNHLASFEKFFTKHKDEFYKYLWNLNNNSIVNYDTEKFIDYFHIWLGFFEWKFWNIYLYQNEDIAEIYQSLNYLGYLITEFQEQSDSYDLFHNILFEIYNHVLDVHVKNLMKNR